MTSDFFIPSREVAAGLVLIGVGLTWLLWRVLVQIHARRQAPLLDTLDKPEAAGDGEH